MSWLYSRALVEAYSEATWSDGEPFALSNVTPTPQAYWSVDKTTDSFPRSLSGMTFVRLTEQHGADVLTWFLADSLARISPSPEGAPESTENAADCGGRWRESFARWDHGSCSWRTHQLSLLGDLIGCSVTWPRWGIMRDGVCSELTMPAHLINEIVSGLWPTPTVNGNHNRKGLSPTSGDGLATAVRKWPTPTAQDAKNNGGTAQMSRDTKPLNAVVGGPLNPTWVEWLMGWPLGWTDLAPLATDKYQRWRRSHGEL